MVAVTEEDRLLTAAASHLRSITIAALDSGMRRREILTERWEHVDFTWRIFYVTHSKTARGEVREIPLTERIFADLEARRKPEDNVFTFDKQPISRIKTPWKGALRRAGMRYFRFHDLRHASNTRLLQDGVQQEIRKALMGHSSGEDVNSIYTHVELPAKREAIQKLERWAAAEREAAKEKAEKEKEDTKDPTTNTSGNDSDEVKPHRKPGLSFIT